jgi:serine phosphatase RsbU (regulator of sigma subunit)
MEILGDSGKRCGRYRFRKILDQTDDPSLEKSLQEIVAAMATMQGAREQEDDHTLVFVQRCA